MGREASEKKLLYDAASNGDVQTFEQLLHQDPYLLEEVSLASSRNILHIAAMRGQVGIVEEVLKINPLLARDLDSKKWSPLHTAAAQGNFELASRLLSAAPEMCWWRDCQGMNPIHIAAMSGHVEILEELIRHDPFPAMERVHRGQTVLHLCVKHRQLEALRVLAQKLGELVCAKDDDGDSILHLAVRCNQVEMIQYLVESNKIEQQTTNSLGKTPLKILEESSPHASYSEIKKILTPLSNVTKVELLPKITDIAMVVVVLIATMAFQAAVSPPGGVWQDDGKSSSSSSSSSSLHKAGEAVMASTHPKMYKHFIRANTTAFVSSLVTIFLLNTRLPSKYSFFLVIAVYAMWVSLASIAVSYGASVVVITPASNGETQSIGHVIKIVVAVSLSFFGMLLVWIYYIKDLYSSWKTRARRQGDFPTDNDPLIHRVIYRVFQSLKDFETVDLLTTHQRLRARIFRWLSPQPNITL